MQRYGTVEIVRTGQLFNIVWASRGVEFERIDLISDLDEYNFVDTSSCEAAYYRKSKEYFYGQESLITNVLHTKSTASICHAKMSQTVNIVDGQVIIRQEKYLKDLGIHYSLETTNGLITHEHYEADGVRIIISYVETERGIDIPPINLSMYKVNGVSNLMHGVGEDIADFYSLDYLKVKYPIDHIEEMDFVVVTDEEIARQRLKRFKDAPTKIKAIDIETTGLGMGIFEQDVLTGMSIAQDEQTSTYFPFRQERCDFNLPISFLAEILDAINNQPEDVLVVAHNGTMEYKGIWKEEGCYVKDSDYAKEWDLNCEDNAIKDPFLRIDRDSFILSILVDPVMRKGLHTLKNRALEATGRFYLELKHIFRGEVKFNILPPEIIRYYACPDTPNTITTYKYLLSKLPEDEKHIFELESSIVYLTAIKEFYGLRRNGNLLLEKLENEEFKVKKLSSEFKKIHSISSNINSPDVRRDIFYNRLRCPVEVRTKSGLPSTSAIALKRLVNLGTKREHSSKQIVGIKDLFGKEVVKGEDLSSNRYPSLVILQAYAKATKELGAYKRIQRKSVRDRVKFNMNQAGAGSGRETSDAHQYSDGMKQLVLSDSKYHHLWSCDWKQVELRVLAYLAGQQDLIELESDMRVDVHRAILSIINNIPIYMISNAMRKKGKSTNFGVVYMMSEYGLASTNHGPAYTQDDVREAAKAITDFYNGLPYIKKRVVENEKFVREHGYIKTMMGRYRYFSEILDPLVPEKLKKKIVRAANNTPVQGFGADLLKLAQQAVGNYIHQMGWDKKVDCGGVMLPLVRVMLTIHDEMLVSSHESIAIEEIIKMFKYCMEIDIGGAPPFFAAPAMISNWYDGKKDAYEIDLEFRDQVIEAWDRDKTSLLHVETYLEDLNNYRNYKLKVYMEDLIAKYHTVDKIAEHVVDNELTHTIISVYVKEEEHLEHLEARRVAVERYLVARKEEGTQLEVPVMQGEEVKQEIIDEEYISICKFLSFDENGEVIEEEEDGFDGGEEDDDSTIKDIIPTATVEVEQQHVVYTLDKVIVDLSSFDISVEAEEINQEIATLGKEGAFYRVVYNLRDGLVPSEIMVEYIPEQIENAVKKYV